MKIINKTVITRWILTVVLILGLNSFQSRIPLLVLTFYGFICCELHWICGRSSKIKLHKCGELK